VYSSIGSGLFLPGGGTGVLVFDIEMWINLVVVVVMLAMKIFAFVTALLFSSESYVAADKLTKVAWCLILGVALLLQVVAVSIPFVNLAALIAVCVYLADVRPALSGLRRR